MSERSTWSRALDLASGRILRSGSKSRAASGDTRSGRFARGVAMGALVGAAVTGLLHYRLARKRDERRSGRP